MSSNGEYPKVWRLTLYCWVWLGLLPKFFNEQNLFLVQNSKILHFLGVKSEFYHTPKCDQFFLLPEILIRPRNFISLQFSQKQLKSSRGFCFIGNWVNRCPSLNQSVWWNSCPYPIKYFKRNVPWFQFWTRKLSRAGILNRTDIISITCMFIWKWILIHRIERLLIMNRS